MLSSTILALFGAVCVAAINYPGGQSLWKVTPKYHILGLENVQFNDIDSCLANCYNRKECFVVDFDTNTKPPCWVQTKSMVVDSSQLKPMDTVTNYMLSSKTPAVAVAVVAAKPKAADLTTCWTVTPKNHLIGLVQAPYNDVPSCTDYCFKLKDCYAVDFDTNTNPKCWVQTSPSVVPDVRNLFPMETVTNYILNKSCKK
ncbi:hypothetical protein HELRODRAFT_189467 [Helobdella robusta]|uniref:Apple domain-containing protein n=1 Tax=Helobdella robusta TaxID=6412 RepID=T1FR29_HELRO|nr:hypothetical protein HELRODRAFT_189467 [Helobdella robusta]ESN94656.1 hypothetical protein HELRODRAFT_189467 [Helobdella robusta]